MAITSIWDNVNLTEHIRNQYKYIYNLNLDEIKVVKRTYLEGRNFFREDLSEDEVEFTLIVNINPVRDKPFRIDKETITKEKEFEIYTDPQTYPDNFEKFLPTDIIIYQNQRWRIERLQDVALNRNPMLWQHFFMRLIN